VPTKAGRASSARGEGVERTTAEIGRAARAEAHVIDAGSSEDIHTPAVHVRKLLLDYTTASASAEARPIPDAAPKTKALLPVRSKAAR
jgi:hypothetical protein